MTPQKPVHDPKYAAHMDADDPLRSFREQFHLPLTPDGDQQIYFCGNSLGLQPKQTRQYVEEELQDWASLGVEGHFRARHPWMPYHELLREQTAAVVGALPEEVVVMNTLTVNLHLLMVSFYRPTPERFRIIIEGKAFPSDQYAVASQAHFHGFDPADAIVEIPPGEDGRFSGEAIFETVDRHRDDAALLLLGGVNYYNGQFFDIAGITAAARKAGITVGVDLAHAAGNVPLHLHDWDVDFAAWCSYKYLNGGPGATAGCYVHERYAERPDLPRFAGWWGHDASTRFDMPPHFHPMRGAEGWQLSNPAILPLAALRASMDQFAAAGMDRLREKSMQLTAYMESLLLEQTHPSWSILTPEKPQQRGCQLSLRIREGGRDLFRHLAAHGVVGDWREPDVIRVAPAPLYNTFDEVRRFAGIFHAFFADKD